MQRKRQKTYLPMEGDYQSSKLKNKIQSLVPIHSVISAIKSNNPKPKTARKRGNSIWGKKTRTGIKRREGSSPRNTFQLHLKPKKDGFKYGSLTTACQAVMLNPPYFEYVMELHKKAYCISLSHSLKLILFRNARNKITGK